MLLKTEITSSRCTVIAYGKKVFSVNWWNMHKFLSHFQETVLVDFISKMVQVDFFLNDMIKVCFVNGCGFCLFIVQNLR